ncbi:universal stress protein [Nocardioides panaciterrulae]|uniref:Nucleotide-binding universal stress UspA family protein n=1 Tax=Nocardioides panaciterrulae TaxID=661492 RepID=A0A7Y9E7F8_9ACTN|nr:universal stress protein [Nocardioides panaciterrulae]NYD42377.1 nucleotide-binding universal stress UspA family protein [Nocardioides panaciterrulae]
MAGEVPSGAITVGVDESEVSLVALHRAVREAELQDRPLCIVHAYDPRPTVYSALGAMVPPLELTEALDQAAEEVLHHAGHLARAQAPKVRVTLVWSTLDAREALAECGRSSSLLVLASRGRSTMRHLLLGSVGLWVSQHAPCPVLVVRGEHDERGEPVGRRWIVVGTDGTPQAEAAVGFAFDQASRHGAPLTVTRCLPVEVGGHHRVHEGPVTGDTPEGKVLAEQVAALSDRYPHVRVESELVRGPAVGHLTRLSEAAGLVVLGSRPRHGPGPWGLGGVRRAVAEHAHCSVAVVPAHPTSTDPSGPGDPGAGSAVLERERP